MDLEKVNIFIDRMYDKTHIQTLNALWKFIGDDYYNIIDTKFSSSNKSLIIITKDSVYKLMSPINSVVDRKLSLNISSDKNTIIEYNKEAIPLIMNCNISNVVCIKDITINSYINIIKYEKLDILKPISNLKNLLLLLYDISVAFNNIHNLGYTHNDIFLENIGCRYNKDNAQINYIVYDFELSKPLNEKNKYEEMLYDVTIFLESVISHYPEADSKRTLVTEILNKLNTLCKIETEEKITIRKRSFPVYECRYKSHYFKNIIIRLSNKFKTEQNIKKLITFINEM